jgi:hypothetical protein
MKEPSFKFILQDKIDLLGKVSIEAYESAADEYHRQMTVFEKYADMPEFLKKQFVVYFYDIDPDTGDVSQMKPVAYTELENYANEISAHLNNQDDGGDGSRKYKFIAL